MNKRTKAKIGLLGSVLLLLASLVTIFTMDRSTQTVLIQYLFLLSGLAGVIINSVILNKTD